MVVCCWLAVLLAGFLHIPFISASLRCCCCSFCCCCCRFFLFFFSFLFFSFFFFFLRWGIELSHDVQDLESKTVCFL